MPWRGFAEIKFSAASRRPGISAELAGRMEMFSVCLAAARAQSALIFRAPFFISEVSVRRQGDARSWDGPDRYRRAGGSFIIVRTRPAPCATL